jgi:hypothetical protein
LFIAILVLPPPPPAKLEQAAGESPNLGQKAYKNTPFGSKSSFFCKVFPIVVLALAVTVFSPPVTASGAKEKPQSPVPAPATPANPFYTGDGGKGKSLAILAPKATGLAENQNYIPALAQGEFVSNFSGYSAISVLDRVNLDAQYAELGSGYYPDDEWDLGHLPPTDYYMFCSITGTSAGYALQIQITKTADKMTAASYSGTCTFAELDNLAGIRRASLELLEKMGVAVTERTKTELAGAAAANHVNGQTALARGITAQRNGTVVEALSYYYEAAKFDPGLAEAASRSSVLSADITGGNIGQNVRNDIQRRNEWLKLLTEADNFFKDHIPFEIVYNPALTQGKIDYQKETVDMSFWAELRPADGFRIAQNILDGLKNTEKIEEWGFEGWPVNTTAFNSTPESGNPGKYHGTGGGWGDKRIIVVFALINEQGSQLATVKISLGIEVGFYSPPGRVTASQYGGKRDYTRVYVGSPRKQNIVFSGVNANDITDNLTIRVNSVDGLDAVKAGIDGYIRISTE